MEMPFYHLPHKTGGKTSLAFGWIIWEVITIFYTKILQFYYKIIKIYNIFDNYKNFRYNIYTKDKRRKSNGRTCYIGVA